MADPYVPGLAVARSVYDQGIAPFAQRAQDYLKGAAGIPGAIKDYAVETVQSEAGPTNKVMADILTLGQGMRQGVQENPVRALAEINPIIGTASGVFESNRLMNQAEQAEQAGDFKKAQTLRKLGATALLSMIPGVFHGSPYKFNKFSMNKVNTGEGSQAFGYGLYFAENPATGTIYKEVLAPVDGNDLTRGKSYLYEADLDVDRKKLMDWDAPLKDQPENVQKALAPYANDYTSSDVDAIEAIEDFLDTDYAKSFPNATDVKRAKQILDPPDDLLESIDASEWLKSEMEKGTKSSFFNLLGDSTKAGTIYERMSRKLKNNYFASKKLSEEGVPGIKYWDQESRVEGKGTRNFVIFDDKNVKIKSRNGESLLPEETPPQTPDAFDEKLQSIYRNIMTNKDAPVDTPVLPEQSRTYGYDSPQDTALRNKLKKKAAGGASADIKFSMDRDAPGMDFESWNMINDPEHFIKSRGKITNIERMSPTEYIERVSKDVFPTFGEAEIRRQRERTGKIPLMMEAMQEGTEFGLPTIHYDDGTRKFPSQEGLHRAMAAERLGVPEIPVAIHQLDRSPAARAARAEEFGFDMDNIYYHGTSSDFTELKPSTVGDLGEGNYITPNPEKASGYAAMRKFMKRHTNNASPNVLPLRIKSDLKYLDIQGRSILPFDDVRINNLKEQGYDGIRQFDADGNVVQINVFDPKNIRSINADFNPMRMNEADLQAGIASLGTREGTA